MRFYTMFFRNGKELTLLAKNNKEAIKMSLTFINCRMLKDDDNNIILLNMGRIV